jgi:anti-sigma regulatory factor (Ser/Thr protein kinase)
VDIATGVGRVTVRVEQRIRRRPVAAPRARALAAEALAQMPSGPEHDDVALVVTELIANAVRHGRGRHISFRLEADAGRVLVEVENRCWTTRPRRRPASLVQPSGRGLAIVAAMSHRWGVAEARRGRARVWAQLEAAEA